MGAGWLQPVVRGAAAEWRAGRRSLRSPAGVPGGAALLGLASLACAFAPTIGVLVASRVAAGIGAALLLPSSLAIVRVAWPEPRARRHALGVWASCNGLAFAIGPTVGGLLVQHFGWRSVFVLAVPFVLAASVLAGWVVPNSADPEGRVLDLRGQMFGVLVLGGLVFAAIDGHQGGVAWIWSLSAACFAAPLFVWVERRAGAAALVPLELFRQPPFCGAFAATAGMTFGIYGMIFLLPLLWQASGLLRPEGAGLALLPCALVFFLISPRSGHLTNRLGLRVMTAGGTAIVACGLMMLATTHAGRPLAVAEFALGLTGIGMGLNTGPLMSVAVDSVHAGRSGTASALINVARMAGATLGVAVLGAAFTLAGSGAAGFRAAMLMGAVVQLAGAWAVWKRCVAFRG
jgi:MFS transporter, DHA2 family, methylenomycin A resistance protein